MPFLGKLRSQVKVESSIIPTADMPRDAEIASVSYQKYPKLCIKILMGNQVWLINEGDADINLPE
eukprot:481767-Pyramimonas_sp.AAC.1